MQDNPVQTTQNFSARRPMILGFIALLILVGGFGTWSVASKLSGAVIAEGQVQIEQNRKVVQHLDGGVVTEILIDEGDTVQAGDVLIRLDAAQLASQLTIIEGQYFELLARQARFEAERDGTSALQFSEELIKTAEESPEIDSLMQGQTRLFNSRMDGMATQLEQLDKRKTQISRQLDGLAAQITALKEQLVLIREELASQQSLLDKGLSQASRVLALKREEAAILGRLGELTAAQAEAELRITETELQSIALQTDLRERAITELRDGRASTRDLAEQRRSTLEQLERLEVRAPVSGVIHGLQVFAEQAVIQPAQPVLYVVPQDRDLVIMSRVDPLHIDQIFVGQTVYLKFPAFNSRETPDLLGRVTRMSADSFVDDGTGQSFYQAEVQLEDGEIERLPKGAVLIPGMPVSAFIRTTDRSPMLYLVEPLWDYFTKAFRET
ncbi:HlyD family type I secretion periplasmic adaptor subunit [Aliiroseovarius sp. F20344]|uniref:HlyD family type I secretion periplasmic adaptor subunit n=1 Tax=Aliiroseovarius sp. F20344 TaxID=2926414 RepID=UPI001FF27E16|nr:HlyD family type I secretion periplasmic adaptor subunit [Aliiroseovarius sp. F20344]MCK0143962.1 HlyD family type I secretion periplasmic adaptor subunit [Aliiroseovarius sp. F20344]